MDRDTTLYLIKSFFLALFLVLTASNVLMAQCVPVCKEYERVSLCAESTLALSPEMVVKTTGEACLKNYIVQLIINDDTLDNTVDLAYLGDTIPVLVTDTLNQLSCEGSIIVEQDETAPEAVCDEFTVTALPEEGSVVLCADNFDSGSFDNCLLKSIKIRRMEDSFFKDCIRFDCDDFGSPVRIVLRATDFHDLYDECMIQLDINEKIPPVIECPEDKMVSCETDPDNLTITGRALASDNCEVASITYTDVDERTECGVGIIKRTWIATDIAGNKTTCLQTINFEITRPPIIFFPSDIVANCTQAEDLDFTGRPRTLEQCTKLLFSFDDHIFFKSPCEFKIVRAWSVLDWCSFTEFRDTQIIRVSDDLGPAWITPQGSLDAQFVCPDEVAFGVPEAEDDCTEVTVSVASDVVIPGACPNQFTRIVTYIAVDECNNSSVPFPVTLEVNDNVAPMADALPDLGPFQCFEDIPPARTSDLTGVSDNCGGPVIITHLGDSPDPGCSGIVTRTYRLEDECGNATNITQSIEINDNTAPTTNPLPDLGPFACFAGIPAADIGIVVAMDNCGGLVTVIHKGDSPDPGCIGTIMRFYEVTDECGNTATVTQNILINDDVSPTAMALPDLGPFDCYEERTPPDIGDVIASDNCGLPVTVVFAGDSPDPGCKGVVVRTYNLTDACGNTAFVTQNILIDDQLAPTADPLGPIGPFKCLTDIPAPNPGVVTGESDNCGGPVFVEFVTDSAPPGCQGFITRNYSIRDECGNTAIVTQLIEINDDEKPTADPLPDLGPFECLSEAPPNIEDVTGEADNCGNVTVTFIGDTDIPACSGFVTRTYRVTDDCGNFIDLTQQIELNDVTPPTADPLPDVGPFACADEIPLPNPDIVINRQDNCGGEVTVTFKEDTDAPICQGVVVRTYTVADQCGNAIEITQNFSINDTIAPNAVALDLGPFTCFDSVPIPDMTTLTNIVDNCGVVRITFTGPMEPEDPGCDGFFIRNWRLRDECDNRRTIVQRVFILDNVPPTADPLPDLGPFACLGDIPEPDTSIVMNVVDNCPDTAKAVIVRFGGDIIPEGCSGNVIRTYLLEDVCGNIGQVLQNIIVEDNVPPTGDIDPSLGSFTCAFDLPAPDISLVTNTADNCGGIVTVSFTGDFTDPGCSPTVRRVYTLTDECGNTLELVQTATLNDDVPPVITCPADVTIEAMPIEVGECDTDVTIVATAADNCRGVVTITNDSPFANAGGADASGSYPVGETIVTFTAEDACGNSSTCQVVVNIADRTSPTLRCQAAEVIIQANGMATLTPDDVIMDMLGFDFCTPVSMELSKSTFDCTELGQNTVTLNLKDDFNNETICTTSVVVSDPNMVCGIPSPLVAAIGGKIINPDYIEMSGIMVYLSEGMEASQMTDKHGLFLFPEVPMYKNYLVTPFKNDDHLNGVSTLDIVLLSKHILGIQELNSPYKLIAADVNNSGTITANDIIYLRQAILNLRNDFPNNTSWRFIRKDHVFTNQLNPFADVLPEKQLWEQIQHNQLHTHFIGVKVGDVSGDVRTNGIFQTETRSAKGLFSLQVPDHLIIPGEEHLIVFRARDLPNLLGYQFTLEFDATALEYIGLIPGDLPEMSLENYGLQQAASGYITTSFVNLDESVRNEEAIVFTLKVKGKAKNRLSSLLKISSLMTRAEAYHKREGDIGLMDVSLQFEGIVTVENESRNAFRLYQNRPNPFDHSTIIGFELPEAASATLSIFDLSGKVIQIIRGDFIMGYNEVHLQADLLPENGIFYYQLNTPFGKATQKMVKLHP